MMNFEKIVKKWIIIESDFENFMRNLSDISF